MNELLNVLDKSGSMPEGLKEQIQDLMTLENYPRKGFLIKPGKVNHKVFFIVKGIVRCYKIHSRADSDKEQEINRSFLFPNDFIGSLYCSHSNVPEDQYVQALKPSTVLVTTVGKLEAMLKRNPEFYEYGYDLWCRYRTKYDKISDMLRLTSAAERYEYLIGSFPELHKGVAQKYLASFMGIDASTLSKISKRINIFSK